jgi:serine acetyltransferase
VDLFDRELQFLARSFERQISLQAQVYIESVKDFGRRWMLRHDFADGLG